MRPQRPLSGLPVTWALTMVHLMQWGTGACSPLRVLRAAFRGQAPFLRSCLKRRWSEHCTGRACTVPFASAPEVRVFRFGSRLLPSSLIKAPPTATEVTCNAPGPSGFVPLSQQMQPVAGTAFDLPACLSIEALSQQMQHVASSAHVPPLPRHRWFGLGSSLSQPVHPCGSTALSEGRSGSRGGCHGYIQPPACLSYWSTR